MCAGRGSEKRSSVSARSLPGPEEPTRLPPPRLSSTEIVGLVLAELNIPYSSPPARGGRREGRSW